MKIVFSADLHGNLLQYEALVSYALSSSAEMLLIGGDLFPKPRQLSSYNEYTLGILSLPRNDYTKSPTAQVRLFKNEIFPRLRTFLVDSSTTSQIVFCLGNSDFWAAEKPIQDFLSESPFADRFRLIQNEFALLVDNLFEILTLSYIPFKGARALDWQRIDRHSDFDERKVVEYRGWCSLDPEMMSDLGIEDVPELDSQFECPCVKLPSPEKIRTNDLFLMKTELDGILKKRETNVPEIDERLPTIILGHCPPGGTPNSVELPDLAEDLGSFEVRRRLLSDEAIRDHKFFLYLCGHVHDAPDSHDSSDFSNSGVGTIVGGVPIVSAGNDPFAGDLSVVVIDIETEEGNVRAKSFERVRVRLDEVQRREKQ